MARWAWIVTALIVTTAAAVAQSRDPAPLSGVPSVITGGSDSVSVGGMAAARKGDATDGGAAVVEGSSNVFINGKPAVTVGDRTGCGGLTIGGASNVFINGKPVARAGDLTTGCAEK
jgi:uncharacterized Zn-binding protein involved in type VI secretion